MNDSHATAPSVEANLLMNKQHFDKFYEQVQVQDIIACAHRFQAFLHSAIQTDTSWHGMYHGQLQARLAGKRVLELGAGDGLNATMMALLGAQVTATDISDATEMIINEVNRQLGLQIQSITGDFSEMDFQPKSFDFVIGKAFLHHLTHEIEEEYLGKVAVLLKPDGEARFFEPAVNSQILDQLRWIVPLPDRPSILSKKAFQVWKENDPHPERDNSSEHFQQVGSLYFDETTIVLIGSIERLCRFLPGSRFNNRFRRWAHRAEVKLPGWFRHAAARSQLIVFRKPRRGSDRD